MTAKQPESPEELRRRAEEQYRLDCMDEDGLPGGSPVGTENLLHELRVHQIELEMQNEELRRSQQEIETVRARYFDLYDLAPVGYLTFSEKGLIRETNLAAETMIGVARRNLHNKPMSQFIPPEDQDAYYLHRKKLLESAEPVEWDMRMLHADGSSFWVHLHANSMQDGNYQIAFSDISRRKQTDDVQSFLARSGSGKAAGEPFFNTLARFLAQNLDMDFVCIDRLEGDGLTARTVAVWCDGHFEDNVTYALKNTPCGDVVGKDVCCFPASVCQFFPRDQVLQDLRAESYVGVTLWSHVGQPIGLIALIGRKPLADPPLAETVLKMVAVRAADELERLEFEVSLQAKNTEMERFTYTVSHDLKSPLITIQSYAGMILKDMEAGRYERAIGDMKRIEDAAGKMNDLLNDLLELSRVGRQMNASSLIDMNLLIKDTLAQLAGSIMESQVEVAVQPDLPALHGDHKRIAEVVQNLVENAIKYRGGQTALRIEIGTRNDGKESVFFVSDNGKGIEPRFHESIFGLFKKLDGDSEGTGIGLALVKRIIELHGGKVWVESEGVGMGSTFCFTLRG